MLLGNAQLMDKIETSAELDLLPNTNFISSSGFNKLNSQLQSTDGITLIADFWNHHHAHLVNVFISHTQKKS